MLAQDELLQNPAVNHLRASTYDAQHPAPDELRGCQFSAVPLFDIRKRHCVNILSCLIHWQVTGSSGFTQRLICIDRGSTHFSGFLHVFHFHAQYQTPTFSDRVVAHGVFNDFTVVTNTGLCSNRRILRQLFISVPEKSTTNAMVPSG